VHHANRLPNTLDTVWRDILSLPTSISPNFSACYYPPTIKREGDLQWHIMHGAYTTGTFLYNAGYRSTTTCPFCDERDTLLHIFFECPQIQTLLTFVSQKSKQLVDNAKIHLSWFFINPPSTNKNFPSKTTLNLFTFITSTAKMAIHLSRRNKVENTTPTDPLMIFKSRIRARILLEFEWHKLKREVETFRSIWTIHDVVCR
jgi:hypothetical protein